MTAFQQTYAILEARLMHLVELPLADMQPLALKQELYTIAS